MYMIAGLLFQYGIQQWWINYILHQKALSSPEIISPFFSSQEKRAPFPIVCFDQNSNFRIISRNTYPILRVVSGFVVMRKLDVDGLAEGTGWVCSQWDCCLSACFSDSWWHNGYEGFKKKKKSQRHNGYEMFFFSKFY